MRFFGEGAINDRRRQSKSGPRAGAILRKALEKPGKQQRPALPAGKAYRVGELFCGAGGFALGACLAKYKGSRLRHVWANDSDKDACGTFRHNIEINPDKVICADVKNLDFNRLGPIDGLLFGFPCNDFSVVGEKKGLNGNYGPLYSYGARALRHFQPLFFAAENVGGLQTANKSGALPIIKASFEKEGYDVFEHLYKFEAYGVPQKRRRLVFAGFQKKLRINFSPPQPADRRPMTARQALRGIPESAPNHEPARQNRRVIERLRHIDPGENAFTAALPDHLKLNMKSGAKISQIYKRLKPDEPAYTITGSGGGGTHVYHWKEPRALTNRERARLQAFPDDFVFKGSKESVRRQIGMAIPPRGISVILSHILKALHHSPHCGAFYSSR